MDGEEFSSVTVHSGVRQGCPLSPTLFALCIDMLLEALHQSLPNDSLIRAFADDIGWYTKDNVGNHIKDDGVEAVRIQARKDVKPFIKTPEKNSPHSQKTHAQNEYVIL